MLVENEKKPVLKKAKRDKYIKPDKEKRSETLMNVRLTKAEKALLKKEYLESPFGKKADFIRFKLFDTTYSDYRKKQYEGLLMNEIQKLGTNINQIAKRLNTFKEDRLQKNEIILIGRTAKLLVRIEKILKHGG